VAEDVTRDGTGDKEESPTAPRDARRQRAEVVCRFPAHIMEKALTQRAVTG
jgi:hypothetical protein